MAASGDNRPVSDGGHKGKKDEQGILKQMRDRFGQCADNEAQNRETFIEDVDFSSSDDQWPNDIKDLRGTGRPMLTINRLNGTVKQIEGDYRQNKLSIHVLPSSGDASEDTADILGGLIRNIEQQSKAEQVYLHGLRYASRGGFSWFRVMPEYATDDTFEQDLFIRPIFNPLNVYCDPKARLATREDARYMFVAELMDKEEFKADYPDASLDFVDGLDQLDDSFETWVDGEQIRVCEYFTKEKVPARLASFDNGAVIEIEDDKEIEALAQVGWNVKSERQAKRTQIRWRKCTGAEILEERVYKMKYIPVIPVLGEEINIRGKVRLRSAVYYGKDPQRMYNYWKTAATESVALQPKTPYLLTAEQVENFEEQWKNVNNKPQPYLLYQHKADQPPPQLIQPPGQPIGEMAMAGGANVDIQYTTNTFDSNLGQKSNEVSGVAIEQRQHQGTTGNFLFIDNLKTSIEHCGRVLLEFIPLIYDSERVIRTIGLEGDSDTTIINKEIKNPLLGITEVLNDITIGKYDLIVEAGQAFASRRAEAVEGMLKFAQAFPQQAPLIADLMIKNMDVPGGEVMAERIERSLPPQITTDPKSPEGQAAQQQAQQQQQQQQQLQQQMMQANIQTEQGKNQAAQAKSGAEVVKAKAEVIKAHADVQATAIDSHTNAIQAQHDLKQTEMAQNPPAPVERPMSIRREDVENNKKVQEQSINHQNQTRQMLTMLAQHLVSSHEKQENNKEHLEGLIGKIQENHNKLAESNNHIHEQLARQNAIQSAPLEVIRDKAGRITGSRRNMNASA
jgi:hypothetical protein